MACFDAWDIGGCGCSSCTQTFTFRGCNNSLLTGANVRVRASSGGTILTTGTTNGSGVVTLSWSGSNTVWVETVSPKFAGQSQTVTCGGSKIVSFNPASGYYCVICCAYPVPSTLYWSDSYLGLSSIPITYDAPNTRWDATTSCNYPGCGANCSASTINVLCAFLVVSTFCLSYLYFSEDIHGCPVTGTAVFDAQRLTVTSADPFAASGTSPGAIDQLYCATASVTRTVTE